MERKLKKVPGTAHFGFFIIWACLITLAVIMLEDALKLELYTPWSVLRFFLPFILLMSLGIYLWERQRQVLEELYRLSITDAITGAYNRHFLYERLSELLKKPGAMLSIVFIDIDNFKDYNDRFGHAAGDNALRSMANVLGLHLYTGEFVVRYGGDEFIVVLFRNDVEANRYIDLSLKNFREYTTLSASAGIAQLRPEDTPETLIKLADDAMYAKKEKR